MIEKIIIGTLLKSARSISQVDSFLKPCHFSDNTYANIYEQILNEPEISLLNLAQKMGVELPFLVDLTMMANEPALVNNAIDLVNKYLCKQTELRADNIKQIASSGDIETVYDELEQAINEIKTTASGSDVKTIEEILKESELKLTERVNKCRKNEMLGVPVPFKELQFITAGLQQGLYILAARPGQGKTAMGLKFARTALEKGFKVAYFSLEMSAVSLIDRMIVGESNVSKNKYRHGALTDSDVMTIQMKRKKISSYGLTIIDYPVQNINTIRRESRILKRSGLSLIIIDYIQLIQSVSKKSYNRENEVSEISRGLKLLSKELDVPVIVMAQLNRNRKRMESQNAQRWHS